MTKRLRINPRFLAGVDERMGVALSGKAGTGKGFRDRWPRVVLATHSELEMLAWPLSHHPQ